jgi:hypothetical protein
MPEEKIPNEEKPPVGETSSGENKRVKTTQVKIQDPSQLELF